MWDPIGSVNHSNFFGLSFSLYCASRKPVASSCEPVPTSHKLAPASRKLAGKSGNFSLFFAVFFQIQNIIISLKIVVQDQKLIGTVFSHTLNLEPSDDYIA